MIPQNEMKQFARRLLKSRELALTGNLAAGYSELLDGFESAQADLETGAPAAAILLAEYRLALEIYCNAFGAREPDEDAIVSRRRGPKRSTSHRSTLPQSRAKWKRNPRRFPNP